VAVEPVTVTREISPVTVTRTREISPVTVTRTREISPVTRERFRRYKISPDIVVKGVYDLADEYPYRVRRDYPLDYALRDENVALREENAVLRRREDRRFAWEEHRLPYGYRLTDGFPLLPGDAPLVAYVTGRRGQNDFINGKYVSDGYFADSYYFRKVDGVLYLYFQPDRQSWCIGDLLGDSSCFAEWGPVVGTGSGTRAWHVWTRAGWQEDRAVDVSVV
jgi:hypothetical protein